jgi:hypothetical protein
MESRRAEWGMSRREVAREFRQGIPGVRRRKREKGDAREVPYLTGKLRGDLNMSRRRQSGEVTAALRPQAAAASLALGLQGRTQQLQFWWGVKGSRSPVFMGRLGDLACKPRTWRGSSPRSDSGRVRVGPRWETDPTAGSHLAAREGEREWGRLGSGVGLRNRSCGGRKREGRGGKLGWTKREGREKDSWVGPKEKEGGREKRESFFEIKGDKQNYLNLNLKI